ncbi:MAG TPA: hypothetical protein VGM88_17860 [Kofleriaceae bacterium]|jgi:hypothetical protein
MLTALVVGGWTAWYLGIRAGVIAAIATAVSLVAAAVVPGLTITIYALIFAWSAALYFFGAKLAGKKPGVELSPSSLSWLKQLSKQMTGAFQKKGQNDPKSDSKR